MCEQKWDAMDETDFEEMLTSTLPETLPGVVDVTPWKMAMNQILWGIGLTTAKLNFWGLNYLFPAVGMLLMLLGFRRLRHENKAFRNCFVLSIFRMVYFMASSILDTTVYRSVFQNSTAGYWLSIGMCIVQLVQMFYFWQGLLSVQKKVQIKPNAPGAVGLLAWYAIAVLLGIGEYEGVIMIWAMVIGFFVVIGSLCKLSKALDQAGYAIQPTVVHVSDRAVSLMLLLMLGIGCLGGYLLGSSYLMEWEVVAQGEQDSLDTTRTHLLSLGLPEYVLNDLTAEDVARCQGAEQIALQVKDYPFNKGQKRLTTRVDEFTGKTIQVYEYVYDVKELQLTSVAVKLAQEDQWMVIHHFLWTVDPGFFGTECIQLWPGYTRADECWSKLGEPSGRVLYDKDGQSYAASYDYLGSNSFAKGSLLWGQQSSTDIFATFSMPNDGENYRGYVAYSMYRSDDAGLADCWINYTHQRSWMQYPALTAMEHRMKSTASDRDGFITKQFSFQFWLENDRLKVVE